MQVDIRRHGIEIDEAMQAHLEKRLDHALGRLDHRVARVEVSLNGETGHRGAVGQHCRILVHLKHLSDVMVEDHDAELTVLIDRAVNRVGLAVRRELDRRHSHR